MRAYADELNVSRAPSEARRVLSSIIVPGLLQKIAEHGLVVLVSRGLDELAEFHNARPDGGKLWEIFDPQYQTDASERDSIALFLVDENGQPVGAVGARLRWCERTLAEEMESLRLFFTDPAGMAPEGFVCTVTARSAREEIMASWLAISGAGYMSPDVRGGGCYKALYRLLHVLMLVEWRWGWSISLIRETQPVGLSVNSYGFRSLEPYVILGGRRDYLACSRRSEMAAQVLRPELVDLKSFAEPTLNDIERSQLAANRPIDGIL